MGELGCEPWWPGPQSRFNHSVMYVWENQSNQKSPSTCFHTHICQPTAYVTSISICALGPISVADSRTGFQHLSHCLLIISYFFSLIFLTGCTRISCSHVLLHLSLEKNTFLGHIVPSSCHPIFLLSFIAQSFRRVTCICLHFFCSAPVRF